MRPTIPLSHWRIAMDLEATKQAQNQDGMPAVGCTCSWCLKWSSVWSSAFPSSVREQLIRLQIDVAHPSDFYAYKEVSGGAHCRVIYHVVGKLLSGPGAWREDPVLGSNLLVYHSVDGATSALALVVVPSSQTFDARPHVEGASSGEILQVDFRLYVSLSPKTVHLES